MDCDGSCREAEFKELYTTIPKNIDSRMNGRVAVTRAR